LAMLQCKLFPSDVEHPNTLQHHVISKYTHVSTAARLNKLADFQDGPHQHINPQALANFSDAAQAHLVEAMAFCDGGTGSILQQSSAKSTNPSLKTRVHVQFGENSDWPIECLIGFF